MDLFKLKILLDIGEVSLYVTIGIGKLTWQVGRDLNISKTWKRQTFIFTPLFSKKYSEDILGGFF